MEYTFAVLKLSPPVNTVQIINTQNFSPVAFHFSGKEAFYSLNI